MAPSVLDLGKKHGARLAVGIFHGCAELTVIMEGDAIVKGRKIMRKLLMISLIFSVASQAFPRTASAQWYPVVANLTPFSQETDFLSAPGFLRYFTHQHYGFDLSYPEAERVINSGAGLAVEALVREIRTLTTAHGSTRLSVLVIPIYRTAFRGEFGRIYGKILVRALCDPKQKLNTLAKTALSSSASTVLPLIMTSLALPAAALPVVVPIVAYVIVLGVDAFCESSRPHGALSP